MAGVQKANSLSRHARHHWCQMSGEGRVCHMKPGTVENPVLGENEGEAACLKLGGGHSGMWLLSLLEEVAIMEKVNVCLPRDAMKAQHGKCQKVRAGGRAVLVFGPSHLGKGFPLALLPPPCFLSPQPPLSILTHVQCCTP